VELRGVAVVNNEFSYEMLWQTYQKEKRSNELQLVPKTFYDDMKVFMKAIAESSAQTDETRIQKDNAARLLNGIFERRKQKILVYVAYSKPLPGPVPQHEAELYEEATKLMKADTLGLVTEDKIEQRLRSTQALPEIILPSGGKIGPLDKDQVVDVKNKDDRLFLVNSKICREV
jgi:DNA replication initiation complex subunit (GINS family)